jgi:hypothetical protein
MAHLANPLATPSQLHHRSLFSALPQDLQEAVFIATQCLTQAAGLLLELPQSVTAQANVILARYWLIDAPMTHEFSVSDRRDQSVKTMNAQELIAAGRLGRSSLCCSQTWAGSTVDARSVQCLRLPPITRLRILSHYQRRRGTGKTATERSAIVLPDGRRLRRLP